MYFSVLPLPEWNETLNPMLGEPYAVIMLHTAACRQYCTVLYVYSCSQKLPQIISGLEQETNTGIKTRCVRYAMIYKYVDI